MILFTILIMLIIIILVIQKRHQANLMTNISFSNNGTIPLPRKNGHFSKLAEIGGRTAGTQDTF